MDFVTGGLSSLSLRYHIMRLYAIGDINCVLRYNCGHEPRLIQESLTESNPDRSHRKQCLVVTDWLVARDPAGRPHLVLSPRFCCTIQRYAEYEQSSHFVHTLD